MNWKRRIERAFDPNVLFAFDSRGGIWAQALAELAGVDTPIVTGFRLKSTGPRKASPLFSGSTALEAGRWSLLLPKAFLALPRETRVLIVDDYTDTGTTCALTKKYLVESAGWPEAGVRTLTLITTANTRQRNQMPDLWGAASDAAVNDLFYMYRR